MPPELYSGYGTSKSCHLFLIRHGETVDNIAGLYAGVRNSALTNHGVQQTIRLGDYFAKSNVEFTHIFSSDLDRAFKTAEAILDAQVSDASPAEPPRLEITKLALLQEQDFGYFEGKPFNASPPRFSKTKMGDSGKDEVEEADFKDMETKDSMNKRANTFLDQHLFPALGSDRGHGNTSIAVVSHGITLSVLWRCLLKRLPPRSISLDTMILPDQRPISIEHLGGWANTGFLELQLNRPAVSKDAPKLPAGDETLVQVEDCPVVTEVSDENMSIQEVTSPDLSTPTFLEEWTMLIKNINCKDHLKGLKRTGGGVGSAKHDENQKSIENFFKKKRHE